MIHTQMPYIETTAKFPQEIPAPIYSLSLFSSSALSNDLLLLLSLSHTHTYVLDPSRLHGYTSAPGEVLTQGMALR